jgi:hypothetical protein
MSFIYNGHMFGEEKNLKDSTANMDIAIKDSPLLISYTKTDKLVAALYMVTDIIDKDEPLRNKLRTLGTEIISDMSLVRRDFSGYTVSLIISKISEIMSFLDIAFAVSIISEMNCNILRKEFSELDHSIKESIDNAGINKSTLNRRVNLSEFFKTPLLNEEGVGGGNSLITTSPFGHSSSTRRREISKGHTSIGVQKGSTLMKALSRVRESDIKTNHHSANDFDLLKKQRRNDILSIIRIIGMGATIKDIKDKAKANSSQFSALASCGEKTLQRELVSMVKDNVLEKTGEKRWSKYSIR